MLNSVGDPGGYVLTDNYSHAFYVSRCNNSTIDPRKYLISILDEEEITPNLQIFANDSNTEMGTAYAFCVF